jgi:uncharacterized membrane protein
MTPRDHHQAAHPFARRMTEGMTEDRVLRVGCVLVGPPPIWQGIQIRSIVILAMLAIQPFGKVLALRSCSME